MIKKIVILFVVIPTALFLLWTGYFWSFFSCSIAGSDPCAETWMLDASEKDLITIIQAVKNEHPELNPPGEPNSLPEKRRYWYDFHFYYSDTNEDIQTWIRGADGSGYSEIALVALYPHFDPLTPVSYGGRKEINRGEDYNYFANKRQISKFENKIVSLIQQKIKDRKNN